MSKRSIPKMISSTNQPEWDPKSGMSIGRSLLPGLKLSKCSDIDRIFQKMTFLGLVDRVERRRQNQRVAQYRRCIGYTQFLSGARRHPSRECEYSKKKANSSPRFAYCAGNLSGLFQITPSQSREGIDSLTCGATLPPAFYQFRDPWSFPLQSGSSSLRRHSCQHASPRIGLPQEPPPLSHPQVPTTLEGMMSVFPST